MSNIIIVNNKDTRTMSAATFVNYKKKFGHYSTTNFAEFE